MSQDEQGEERAWTESSQQWRKGYGSQMKNTFKQNTTSENQELTSADTTSIRKSANGVLLYTLWFITAGFPFVKVPVLSNTTHHTLWACSSASPPLIKIQLLAPIPVATITAVGVVSPRAYGQAITVTQLQTQSDWCWWGAMSQGMTLVSQWCICPMLQQRLVLFQNKLMYCLCKSSIENQTATSWNYYLPKSH